MIEEGGVTGVDHETGKIEKQTALDRVSVVIFKGLKNVTDIVRGFSPVELLSSGRTVTWGMMFRAVLQVVVVMGGLFAALGMYCFTRRELALVKGGQG